MKLVKVFFYFVIIVFLSACGENSHSASVKDSLIIHVTSSTNKIEYIAVSRGDYQDKLHGFWLGQNIAN